MAAINSPVNDVQVSSHFLFLEVFVQGRKVLSKQQLIRVKVALHLRGKGSTWLQCVKVRSKHGYNVRSKHGYHVSRSYLNMAEIFQGYISTQLHSFKVRSKHGCNVSRLGVIKCYRVRNVFSSSGNWTPTHPLVTLITFNLTPS